MNNKIIVTLTSWKKRINTLAPLIYDFYIKQTKKPDKFYLWLSLDEFPNKELDIPLELVNLNKQSIIEIKWLEGNEKTFKRWHVYPKHWNDYVFIIDDDCIYSPTLIEDAIQTLEKNPNTVCNIWQQFSAIPIYNNDIKIKFKYDFSKTNAMWVCGNCVIPPKTFPLDALSTEQTEFKNKHFPTNDEVILNSYFLRNNVNVSILTNFFQFKSIENEAETSLRANTAENINEFGYSTLEIQLYKQLKYMNLIDKYKTIHDGYNPKNYENIMNINNKHVWLKIIVTAHNIENYIEQCINSIINQTYKDFQLVIIDDCSSDNTLNIIKNFEKNNDKIIVISNKNNKRQGISRNIGLKAGFRSDYVWFIDGDDYLPNNNIIQQLHDEIIKDQTFDAFSFKYYSDNNLNISIPIQKQYNECITNNTLFLNGTVSAWSRIHKVSALDVEFSDVLFEDCIFFAMWLENKRKIKDLDIIAYTYRKNNSGDSQQFIQKNPIYLKRYSIFQKYLIDIYNSSKNQILKNNIYMRLKMENII